MDAKIKYNNSYEAYKERRDRAKEFKTRYEKGSDK